MKFTSFILFALLCSFAQAQLPQAEKELVRLGKNIIMHKTESQRLAAADTFAQVLDNYIGHEKTFQYPFSEVKNLSKLHAPDQAFRIYTWSVPLKNGGFTYFGRLVIKQKSGYKVHVLHDTLTHPETIEHQLLKPSNWYGAIYYDIIKTKHKGHAYYSLLGYRPNNRTHNQKLIEVIDAENFEHLRFGAKIFNAPIINGIKYKRRPYRMIFRYNPQASVSIKYTNNHILMDKLSVPDFAQTNMWNLYGPDFTYQALEWHKGKWQLNTNVEVKSNLKPAAPAAPVQQGLPKSKR